MIPNRRNPGCGRGLGGAGAWELARIERDEQPQYTTPAPSRKSLLLTLKLDDGRVTPSIQANREITEHDRRLALLIAYAADEVLRGAA